MLDRPTITRDGTVLQGLSGMDLGEGNAVLISPDHQRDTDAIRTMVSPDPQTISARAGAEEDHKVVCEAILPTTGSASRPSARPRARRRPCLEVRFHIPRVQAPFRRTRGADPDVHSYPNRVQASHAARGLPRRSPYLRLGSTTLSHRNPRQRICHRWSIASAKISASTETASVCASRVEGIKPIGPRSLAISSVARPRSASFSRR